jgi:K+-transporting ATPase ATPase B chain
MGNPVMLLVEIGGILTTIGFVTGIFSTTSRSSFFTGFVSFWLWLTVIFSNFAESLSEGRGKARAASLRQSRTSVPARKLTAESFDAPSVEISSSDLRKGDLVLIRANEIIPGDGEVIKGAALVNEAAITGESAPVVRESGGDRSAVTGGTTVIANEIIIRITTDPGHTFLDRMILMVEGAERRKTPNEIALEILLIALTGVFLAVVVSTYSVSAYSAASSGRGSAASLTVLIALFVCLAPTTIAALLPAIGIAGMDRLFRLNVIALSGRAIEAAGDVNVLLLDKTGTITLGNRQAVDFLPVDGQSREDLMETALLSSFADDTPEGKSIIALIQEKTGKAPVSPENVTYIPFSAATRFSGAQCRGITYLKGASDEIIKFAVEHGGTTPPDLKDKVHGIASAGGTPLVVTRNEAILGVIFLKDILKTGIRERFEDLRKIGIKTIMITGDNHLTAATIAAEAGVDDYLAEAKPDDKLKMIKDYQSEGYMVAIKQIIISSDRPPKEMLTLEDRLRSRFEHGLMADIQSPDYETRMAILKKKEELDGYKIDEEVLKYIATNIKSNIRELEGALTKIVAFSRLKKRELNLLLAEEALQDIISPNEKKVITPELIVEVVAEHYNISPAEIYSKDKSRNISYPRQIVMYLSRRLTDLSVTEIGKTLGNRDHSTVLHGYDKVASDIKSDSAIHNTIDVLIKKINPE